MWIYIYILIDNLEDCYMEDIFSEIGVIWQLVIFVARLYISIWRYRFSLRKAARLLFRLVHAYHHTPHDSIRRGRQKRAGQKEEVTHGRACIIVSPHCCPANEQMSFTRRRFKSSCFDLPDPPRWKWTAGSLDEFVHVLDTVRNHLCLSLSSFDCVPRTNRFDGITCDDLATPLNRLYYIIYKSEAKIKKWE